MDETIDLQEEEMPVSSVQQNEEVVALLRGIHEQLNVSDRLARLETLVEIHLGERGTVPQLKQLMDKVNQRVLLITGAGLGAFYLLKYLGILK